MKGTIIIAEDGRAQALEGALKQAGAMVAPHEVDAGMVTFDYPGSEDELRSLMERAAEPPQGEPGAIPSLDEVERRHITRVLAAAHGNKTLAARILGVDRKTLHRKLSQYARASKSPSGNGVSAHHG